MSVNVIEIKPLSLRDLASFRSDKEEEACFGKCIATESLQNKEVIRDREGKPIAHSSISETYEEARRMGYKDSVVFFYGTVSMLRRRPRPRLRGIRVVGVFLTPISKN